MSHYLYQAYDAKVSFELQRDADGRSTQTLYAGTIKFNILLGATESKSVGKAEVTQEEIDRACQDGERLNIHPGPKNLAQSMLMCVCPGVYPSTLSKYLRFYHFTP